MGRPIFGLQRVRELHHQLASFDLRDRRQQSAIAAELGEMLLGPVIDQLGSQRLTIVADGALHYLPFSVLIAPGELDGLPVRLLETHEVTYLPSLSTLAVARRELDSRPAAPHPLAIFADPVFDPSDQRLREETELADVFRGVEGGEQTAERIFERLPASRREAEAIASLVASGPVLEAYGFAANRGRALSGELEAYRVIHFATHGVIDTQTPMLSGLALSLVDQGGAMRDGFLGLRDIYQLPLAADLVVLSGCRTALGQELRGEGLVGLVQGFLYAGARQVLASLWPVEDRATAELMTLFYRALWREGNSPAAALRQAQREMQQNRRFRDPAFWAGFILLEAATVR